jgi:hypothetical protein
MIADNTPVCDRADIRPRLDDSAGPMHFAAAGTAATHETTSFAGFALAHLFRSAAPDIDG